MKNLGKNISLGLFSLFTVLVFSSSSWAIELDDAVRTIPLNSNKTVTLSPEQVKRGKRLFLSTCSG